MKHFAISIMFVIVFASFASAQNAIVTAEDLKGLEGSTWSGSLSYLDYSSNKKTLIKSNLTVTKNAGKTNEWTFLYEYPDEPKANGSSMIVLADGGKLFNEQTVVAKFVSKNGDPTRIVTTKAGTDNDKPATFRYTYSIGKNSFSIKKEVQIKDSTEWFERNTYAWTR